MKLLNHSLKYISISILVIVTIWSVIFYINMLDEIYDSIDDGLENYKMLIIHKAETDTTLLFKSEFDESNYAIKKIAASHAVRTRDVYTDTLMFMIAEKDLEPVRMLTTAFVHQGDYYELKVISSMVEEDDLIEDLLWSIFWLYVLLVVSIITVNNIILRKLWKPFYKLLEQVRVFQLGKNESLPDVPTSTKEFNELKTALIALTSRSTEAYSQQKQFIENASHELQTPLAIATGKLELMLEKEALDQETATDIAQVLQIVTRLTRLNKSLLLLSKIENRQFSDTRNTSINNVVRQCAEELEDFAIFKKIDISVDEKEQLFVNMDPALASILVSNLLRNAIVHNIPDGAVLVEINKRSLSVANDGKTEALPPGEDIFKRFHRDVSSPGGSGLGLAIVKSICTLYGFTVQYRFTEKHSFTVNFEPIV